MNRATAVLLLLGALQPFIGGCSDRLPPPTGNDPAAAASIAFSWLDAVGTGVDEPSHIGVVTPMGRDRSERTSLGPGIILAMSKNRKIVTSRTDVYGTVSLWYGSIDSNDLVQFAVEASGETIDRASVAISDDGTGIAYYAGDPYNGTFALNVLDMNSQLIPFQSFPLQTPGGAFAFPAPAFSPDGQSIAFVDQDPIQGGFQLVVTPIMSYYPVVVAGNVAPLSSFAIDWSPSGEKILYPGVDMTGGSRTGIYAADPAGIRPVDTVALAAEEELALEPVSSADGRKIAYVTFTVSGQSAIHLFDVASKQDRQVLSSPVSIVAMQWSPDGSKLLYTESDLSVMTPDFEFKLLDGTLKAMETATGRSWPIASDAVRGFWME